MSAASCQMFSNHGTVDPGSLAGRDVIMEQRKLHRLEWPFSRGKRWPGRGQSAGGTVSRASHRASHRSRESSGTPRSERQTLGPPFLDMHIYEITFDRSPPGRTTLATSPHAETSQALRGKAEQGHARSMHLYDRIWAERGKITPTKDFIIFFSTGLI